MLYIVATPIGNLEDISPRAREVLASVDLIAAEDTRRTQALLHHLHISNETIAYHTHNEHARTDIILESLLSGKKIALVSDAGTPLISDPGYLLVKACREKGIPVTPIPGPCALITALSVSGLPTDNLWFQGFLPAKSSARKRVFEACEAFTGTLAFYESPHRLMSMLKDAQAVLGEREVVIARELTKLYETVLTGSFSSLLQTLEIDPNQQKGEFVVMIGGNPTPRERVEIDPLALLAELKLSLPHSQAVKLVAKVTGISKNQLY